MGPDPLVTAPPAAARMTSEAIRVVVAGVAGGVGTTTVAALLASALVTPMGTPQLLDHSGGSLAARIDPAAVARSGDEQLSLHDLGATLHKAGINALLARNTVVLLVAAATPDGLRDAAIALGRMRAAAGQTAPARPILVTVQLTGARPPLAQLTRLAGEHRGLVAAGAMPYDRALLTGGAVSIDALAARTKSAIAELTTAVQAQLPALLQSGRRNRLI